MRRISFFLIILTVIFFVGCEKPGEEKEEPNKDGTSWEIVHTYESGMPELQVGCINNGGKFIAVGAGQGYVAISTDGGLSWNSQNIVYMDTSGYAVEAMDFYDENVGVLGGSRSLFRTEDGGNTWTFVADGDLSRVYFTKIQFLDANNVYAFGTTKLFKSTDAGKTWTAHLVDTLTSGEVGAMDVDFFDLQHGVIVTNGKLVLYTDDGGNTWIPETLHVDDNVVFNAVVGLSSENFLICGTKGSFKKRVVDGDSVYWKGVFSGVSTTLRSIAAEGDNVIAVGNSGNITVSTIAAEDSLMTRITNLNSFGDFVYTDIDPDGNHVLAVGSDPIRRGATIRLGSNNFTRWTGANYGTVVTLIDMYFFNSNEGVLIGKKATIYKTYDGAATLIQKVLPYHLDITLNSVDFFNENDGVIVGGYTENGSIFLTHDGGEYWELLDPENIHKVRFYIDNLTFVHVVSNDVAYIAGSNGFVLKTIDKGNTWTEMPTGLNADLLGMHFISEDEGWIVGNSGVILHTTDGCATWDVQESNTSALLSDVQFIDENNGWICGNFVILKTTDGGNTWKEIEVVPNLFTQFRKLAFQTFDNGWMVGNYGHLIHTVDGGKTWYQQAMNLSQIGLTESDLYSIFILDSEDGWAVGDSGSILRLVR